MPAINNVIITFMRCVVNFQGKFSMIFILALTTILFSGPSKPQTENSFIVLLVDMMILFIFCSSHTMAASSAISIFMLKALLYP
uniref:Putative ovule protein n=1 Tax=Solanum chacoense TaxID=4108 RepID=A0A0V0GM69_SOLCH